MAVGQLAPPAADTNTPRCHANPPPPPRPFKDWAKFFSGDLANQQFSSAPSAPLKKKQKNLAPPGGAGPPPSPPRPTRPTPPLFKGALPL